MGHCEFEATIKVDCVKEIIALARAGEAGNGQIATAIEHACCFGGCAARLYLDTVKPDEPQPPIFTGVSPLSADCSVDEICDSLEEAIAMQDSGVSMDWAQIFNMITMIWQLIQQWRNS